MRTRWLQFFVMAALSSLAGCSAGAGTEVGTGNPHGGNENSSGSHSGGAQGEGGGTTPMGGTSSGGALGDGGNPSGGKASGSGGQSGGRSCTGSGGQSMLGRGGAGAMGGASAGGRSGGAGGGTSSAGGGSGPLEPGKKFVGNITTGNSIDSGSLVFAKYWDQITPENAGKWGSVQSSASAAFNWTTLDQIYDYTKKNNIIFKQHTFIWGSQQPGGSISEANVKNWMTEFCKRYPDTKLIDVVNEPPPHTNPSYVNAIGGGTNGDWKWIVNAFTWARQACPNAVLILNDYNNIEWDSEHAHFIDIVKKIKAGGAPIDAVGCQSHDVAEKSVAQVQKYLDAMHEQTGLPIYITEYDVSDTNDQNQLKIYQQQFPLFWNTEYIFGTGAWLMITGGQAQYSLSECGHD